MAKKLTNVRQKFSIAKMEKRTNLQVTFSKRRNGLFKKAYEFCTLTGAQLILVVFSLAQKAHSFGHPCFESIIDKYLGKSPSLSVNSSISRPTIKANHYVENVVELNQKLTNVEKLFEAEKRREEILDQMRKEGQHKYWWQAPIEELNLEQLQKLEKALLGLKKKIENDLHNRKIQAINLSQYLFEEGTSERNANHSITMGVTYGARLFGLNTSSSFGATVVDSPIRIDLNTKAP